MVHDYSTYEIRESGGSGGLGSDSPNLYDPWA
jgi:hypothetical protein